MGKQLTGSREPGLSEVVKNCARSIWNGIYDLERREFRPHRAQFLPVYSDLGNQIIQCERETITPTDYDAFWVCTIV